MKTVGEFKKAGLQFVNGDKGDGFCVKEHKYFGMIGVFDNKRATHFSWRENTGVKPEFKGVIEFTFNGEGCEMQEVRLAENVNWEIVKKWRPSLNQPSVSDPDTKQSAIHKAWVDLKGDLSNANKYDSKPHYLIFCIKDMVISKSGKYLLTEYVTNNDEYWRNVCTIQEFTDYCEKMAAEERHMDIIGQNGNDGLHYDNTAQQVEALALDDKPIFTQAMADAGELPPVGSLFIDIEYNESKQVLALAHHLGKVVYAADYDDVSQVDYFHADQDCCMALDTRTDREKAIDEMLKDSRCNGSVIEICIERLYDAGYRKC